MTNEDKGLIAGYMGWDIVTVGPKKSQYKIYVDSKDCNIHHEFDLNDASLCVQEMQKRGEWDEFYQSLAPDFTNARRLTAWLFNAEKFHKSMAAWLKEGKK